MPTLVPRWSRNRVLRHRARGTSDALLRHIFRAGGPRPDADAPVAPEAPGPSNVVAFRPGGPLARRSARA